jgi:hypothetical protein
MDKKSKGFIKLDRAIFNHWIFQDAEKFKAFVDLIQLMKYKDETLVVGNEVVKIPRGSYYTSELKLAARWKWSRKKVRAYLSLLSDEGMVIKKGTTKGTILTVENYSFYQGEGTTKRTSKEQQRNNEGPAKEHQKNSEGYTNKERKEREESQEREEGEESIISPLSPLSEFGKSFLNEFGEVAYRTWIEPCEVEETNIGVSIKVPNDFTKQCIESKYKNDMEITYKKPIKIIELGGQ